MPFDFKLDSAGIREVLNSGEVAAAINGLAEAIAAGVRGAIPDDAEVVVDSYSTDRTAAAVTIKDARGKLWQVEDGVLTRAAAATGLEVKGR